MVTYTQKPARKWSSELLEGFNFFTTSLAELSLNFTDRGGTMRSLLLIFFVAMTFSNYSSAETSVEYIRSNAHEFKNTEIPSSLLASIENKNLILIGEQHGTNEMPEYTFKLVEALAQNHDLALGLEFPIDTQKEIDQFLKTGDEKILSGIDFFKDAEFHSGRGSDAMIRFLKNLRFLPKVKVFCFDIPTPLANGNTPVLDRDTKMAKNVLNFIKKNPRLKIVTFSGNIHSRLSVGTPWNPKAKNMGFEILRRSKGRLSLKNSVNVLYRADEGSAWQCQYDSNKQIICKNYSFGPANSVYRTAVPFDRYFLREPQITDGHFNSIFIKTLSASSPWEIVQ
jgi:uncharacterized iron-regulated protein